MVPTSSREALDAAAAAVARSHTRRLSDADLIEDHF
jgi:hypothetical protein